MVNDIDPIRQKVRDVCKKLRPIIGEKSDKLWQLYCFSDEKQRKELSMYLELLVAKYIKEDLTHEKIVLVPPSKDAAFGEYYLGDIQYENKAIYPFGIRENEWGQHVLIVGRSGSGKTNCGFWILKNLTSPEHNKSFVLFDWKRNYRDLLAIPGFEKLKVYTVGRRNIAPLRFNPLIPPRNVSPHVWLKLLIEVISHAYFLGEGVAYILQQAIDSAYRLSGVYEGRTDNYPTFRDILRWLKTYNPKGREINWLSSTLRATASLCFGEMDEAVNIDNNIGVEKLLSEQAILELDSLVVSDRIFIIETLLLWLYQYRLSSEHREHFDHAIIIEEAHHILSQQKRNLSGGETIVETIFRQCRELNESIIVLDQQPAQLSAFCMANTFVKIVMNLKYRKDVDTINKSLLLNDNAREYPVRLGLGQAIVKLQDRIQDAFLIRIPEFRIKKGMVTDEFIKKRSEKPRLSHPITPKEKAFLKDIADFPDSNVVQRYERLTISPREGTEIKTNLLTKGFIVQEDIFLANGRIKKLRLKDAGIKSLQEGNDSLGSTADRLPTAL